MIFISIYERFTIKYFNFFKFEPAKYSLHWKWIAFEKKIVGLLRYQTVLSNSRDLTFMLWAQFLKDQLCAFWKHILNDLGVQVDRVLEIKCYIILLKYHQIVNSGPWGSTILEVILNILIILSIRIVCLILRYFLQNVITFSVFELGKCSLHKNG